MLAVEGGTITTLRTDAAAATQDATGPYAGAFVLPGLIDMHAHFPPPTPLGNTEQFAFLFLHHGVTSIRHAGDIDGTTTEPVRQGVRTGAFPGPRVFACGPFVDGAESNWSNTRILVDPAEAGRVVDEIAQDYDCIKAYGSLSPEAAAALQTAAGRRGIPVIGHVPRGMRFDDAYLDDFQHMMGMTARSIFSSVIIPASLKIPKGLKAVLGGKMRAGIFLFASSSSRGPFSKSQQEN